MKWTYLMFLALGLIIGILIESYAENILLNRTEEKRMQQDLATDITIYKMIQMERYSAALSCIKVPLAANVKTYQYYKKINPQFGKDNAKLEQLINQTIEIVPGAEKDIWPIPNVPTVMPISTNESPLTNDIQK